MANSDRDVVRFQDGTSMNVPLEIRHPGSYAKWKENAKKAQMRKKGVKYDTWNVVRPRQKGKKWVGYVIMCIEIDGKLTTVRFPVIPDEHNKRKDKTVRPEDKPHLFKSVKDAFHHGLVAASVLLKELRIEIDA